MKLPIIGAVLFLAGCAASRTTIQSTWADDAYAGPPLGRIAVVALFDTRAATTTESQSHWIEQNFIVAETALFDNRGDRLLWTAKSETLEDEHSRRTSESIVRTVARQLFAMDLIAQTATLQDAAATLPRG